MPALVSVRKALEQALGIEFKGEKGEHFFRSTLIQTLFYGVFSAWVLWSKQLTGIAKDNFDWKLTAYYLRVSVLRKLFHEVADPGQLLELNLSEVLDWTATVLNRVDRATFFSKFQEAYAVQYFYEPFLEAFDPELRKELGVWYTPPEIVEYMVARVDTALRDELGLADGLADKNVYVLDPCCGTGSYLIEVLKKIHQTLKLKGENAFLAIDIKEAAQKRVFGFELLPAPFVVAHLQLGLLLQNFGAPLAAKGSDRVSVYLTNALTGWELRDQPPLVWPEMEAERAGAGKVKRDTAILVVLGNPPYNGFAGVGIEEERDLTIAYKTAKNAPAPQGQGLNDLYVRFYRMAEHRIAEMTGRGIICFISNYSWLNGLSFSGMREDYLEKFDQISIDCLNGDAYKTGKLTPEGKPDPSVFSTDWNREGIQVGTAIGLFVRGRRSKGCQAIRFRHFWGRTKRTQLLESLVDVAAAPYLSINPELALGLPFMPTQVGSEYYNWPLLTDLLPVSFPGVKTSRDDLVVDIDRSRLVERMQFYFDPESSHEEMRRLTPDAMQNTKQFNGERTRDTLRKRGFLEKNIVRYLYRPFDTRWLYWEPETDLLDRKREEYFPQIFDGNVWVEARQKQTMENFDRGYFARVMADNFGNGLSSFFPLYLIDSNQGEPLLRSQPFQKSSNLTPDAKKYLERLKLSEDYLFYHTISILNAPLYRRENAGALCQDWPRVLLPATADLLLSSAELGRQVAELHDAESAPPNAGNKQQLELRLFGVTKRAGGGSLTEADLAVKAGWGHAGKGGVTMPGKGKVAEREYFPAEREAILNCSKALGMTEDQALAALGRETRDIYLNEFAYWSNVPDKVWGYTVGGYQVLKKWLSYREQKLLGRALTIDEVRYVQAMVQRITRLLFLHPALDANYLSVKANIFAWGLIRNSQITPAKDRGI